MKIGKSFEKHNFRFPFLIFNPFAPGYNEINNINCGGMTMKREKIKIAIIGCGRFARNFVPLFKAHPEV